VSQDENPPIKQEECSLPEELDPLGQHGSNRKYYNWSFATRITSRGSDQAYGASSTFYFVDQLSSYLDTVMRNLHLHETTAPAKLPSSVLSRLRDSLAGVETTSFESLDVTENPTRAEEERLFKVYWDNYDLLYPILEKATFEAYYESLWLHDNTSRNPSPLVDILLAFCMQHDAVEIASASGSSNATLDEPVNSTAGWWFFRRCQYFLQDEIQEPTIMTFQSYALSVFWLSQASWQTAAQNLVAATLRVGVVLGLHIEPSPDTPRNTCAFRKRLWWTLYSIDAQYAMEYGRPMSVNFGQVTCGLPRDNDVRDQPYPLRTSLPSFNTQYITLILATRSIYILFYEECARVLRQHGRSDMREDPEGLEVCAQWLETKIKYLQAWVQHVPEHMKLCREGLGRPYSTDRSRLDLRKTNDLYSRHSILLEILYHTWAMSLYRPFIYFTNGGSKAHILTERHAMSCANHAITLTNIIHQVLHEMDCMRAWHSICVKQLRATIALVGYIVAYPQGPAAFTARQAIDAAIESFELLARTFSRAGMAAAMLRDVVEQVDMLSAYSVSRNPPSRRDVPDATATMTSTADVESFSVTASRFGLERNVQASEDQSLLLPDHEHPTDNIANQDWLDMLLDFGHEAEQ
jgi:hypothetical protein